MAENGENGANGANGENGVNDANGANGANGENGAPEDVVQYKILFVGNTAVGKTTFLYRYCGDGFNPDYVATVGIDFREKIIERGDKQIRLQLWDTAGQERYRSLITAYFRGGSAFLIMFDLTNEDSFTSVNAWIQKIQETTGVENPVFVLVGNKSDLTESRVVTPEQCRELAQSVGMEYFETSVKEDINVKEVIDYIIEALEGPEKPPPETPSEEPKSPSPETKYKCCYC